jgi:hypothetical protein
MKAIGFVESGSGTSPLARNSFNPFGRGARKGNMRFNSIPEATDSEGAYLKQMYFDKGQTTLPGDLEWLERQAVESRPWPYAFLST